MCETTYYYNYMLSCFLIRLLFLEIPYDICGTVEYRVGVIGGENWENNLNVKLRIIIVILYQYRPILQWDKGKQSKDCDAKIKGFAHLIT